MSDASFLLFLFSDKKYIFFCVNPSISPECPLDQLPQDVTDQVTYFRDAISLVLDFSGTLAQSSSNTGLQTICGFENSNTVTNLARSTNDNLCSVAEITVTIRQYFQCSNWYPLYETAVYEAMCYSGTEGFAWVAGTQFVVVCMAMILLTLRGAFYDVEVLDENGDSDSTSGQSVEQRTATMQTGRTVTVSPSQDGGFELSPHNS
jgi:hypothetical protein